MPSVVAANICVALKTQRNRVVYVILFLIKMGDLDVQAASLPAKATVACTPQQDSYLVFFVEIILAPTHQIPFRLSVTPRKDRILARHHRQDGIGLPVEVGFRLNQFYTFENREAMIVP